MSASLGPSAASEPGADFLQLDVRGVPRGGRATWLTARLREAVAGGRLPIGARLPATRVLADDLGVARGVVVEAYRRLADEGVLEARAGAGTRVAAAPVLPWVRRSPSSPSSSSPVPTPSPAAGPRTRVLDPRGLPFVSHRLPASVDLDLSPGVPDLSAFPRAAWLRAERLVLARAGVGDLRYGDPRGASVLREELARWLGRTRGVVTGPDGVLVVAGVAQALALLAHVLQRRGLRRIAVEDPGSRGAGDEFAYWGLEPAPVPVDDGGLVTAALPSTLRAAFVTPAHQFPTGVVLSPERRRALLSWAAGAGGVVIEDDYDAEHRYDRAPVPALQASAPDLVAHTGSTSKTLAPGMRLGWLVPPSHLLEDLVAARRHSDLGSPAIPQLVFAEMLATGAYDRHLRAVRTRQRARRDAVVAALVEHLPAARVTGVAAGLHVLVALPECTGSDVGTADRLLRDAGVLVHPLSWHRHRPGPPGLVLGYAAHPPDRLREAVRRLARVVGRAA
ncbi:MAG: PLP-dependent aminotransferase family protein [Kineosporiaceae bacterium]